MEFLFNLIFFSYICSVEYKEKKFLMKGKRNDGMGNNCIFGLGIVGHVVLGIQDDSPAGGVT